MRKQLYTNLIEQGVKCVYYGKCQYDGVCTATTMTLGKLKVKALKALRIQ